MSVKKLIEVALPLDKINAESAREKSIRHGHPSTLHLWWARRPLAAARAVIWSSLVDDPSSHPELFPTEEAQNAERKRLFKILEDFIVWENSNNEEVLKAARNEILRSTNGNPPALLDPFAGGGAIPLEAQRLGLEAHAHDLNPVAVMINKAMIEIPPKFANMPPVNPDDQVSHVSNTWRGTDGLASDIKYYGEWMRSEAFRHIGHLYPKVVIPREQGGGEATVIAWIWTRIVKCPNPACSCNAPLIKTFDISKKRGNEHHIEISYKGADPLYKVCKGKSPQKDGSVKRTGAICLKCGAPIDFPYIRNEGKSGRISAKMAAVIAEGKKGRIYLTPDEIQTSAATVSRPDNHPDAPLPNNPRNFNTPIYGMEYFADHFTNRQLTMLMSLCDLIPAVSEKIEKDAIRGGYKNDHISLKDGGTGAKAYSEAIAVYLSFIVDKMADYHSSVCSWHASKELIRNTFGRQALPMAWDYAECNPFCNSSGSFNNMLEWVYKSVINLPASALGEASQFNAEIDCNARNIMVSTDPPYYDNIVYGDLADFFYIWMRRSLKNIYPDVFSTLLVPKSEELVATQYRFDGGIKEARDFFENGMLHVCQQIYKYSRDDIPVSIYYAYKQSETEMTSEGNKSSSSGWETMLSAIVSAGFTITGTWPMRTEMATRQIASGSNALASSIVLVCRKRPENAQQTTRRNLVNALRKELRPALKEL